MKQVNLESLKDTSVVAVCLLQHRLIEVLMFEIERLMNACSGADAESSKTIQEWVDGVSNRINSASADIQKIIDADSASATKQ